MPSIATTSFEVPASPEAASAAVLQVVADKKYRLGEQSPDGRQIAFVTRKTLLSWELDGRVNITAASSGARVDLALDNAAGRPKALLDAKKNKRSAEKLAEEIRAAVG